MSDMIYTQECRGAGIASIPLRRVKNATKLTIVRGERVIEYPFNGNPPTDTQGLANGDPVITLQIKEPGNPPFEYQLADWPDAVALQVSDTLYWIENKRLLPAKPGPVGRSDVEERYCPDGFDLPSSGHV